MSGPTVKGPVAARGRGPLARAVAVVLALAPAAGACGSDTYRVDPGAGHPASVATPSAPVVLPRGPDEVAPREGDDASRDAGAPR